MASSEHSSNLGSDDFIKRNSNQPWFVSILLFILRLLLTSDGLKNFVVRVVTQPAQSSLFHITVIVSVLLVLSFDRLWVSARGDVNFINASGDVSLNFMMRKQVADDLEVKEIFDMELTEKSSLDNANRGVNDEHLYSLEDAVETIGFGKFHALLVLGGGVLWVTDSMESLSINSILPPILACKWNLTSVEEAMIATTFFIGQGLGIISWGYLSDMYGRKVILRASALVAFVFVVASSQTKVLWSLLVCRFLVGYGNGGGNGQSVALITEVMPVQHRSKAVLLMKCHYGLGSLLAAGLAIAIINVWGWRYYLLILSSPSIIFLVVTWWMPESPRYLLITGEMDKLNAVVKRIARVNGKEEPGEVDSKAVVSSRGRISDLFTKKFRATTLLLFAMWCTTTFCTKGIALLTTQMFQSGINGCHPHFSKNLNATSTVCRHLSNTDYTDLMETSSAEIPAVLVLLLLIDKIGRKLCLSFQYGISFISIMALLTCTKRSVVVVLISIFRATIGSTFGTLYLYTAEVFPTNVRAVGLGCCSMVARLGSIVTPFVAQVLIHHSFYLVVGAYASTLVLAVVCSLLLKKETNQAPLEDSSADILESPVDSYQTFASNK